MDSSVYRDDELGKLAQSSMTYRNWDSGNSFL